MEAKTTHIVIDMLYDFIDGSLACLNTENAIKETISYINKHPEEKVLYICDYHPINHCSFKDNGGLWPIHCVENTRGSQIHQYFYEHINKIENRPNIKNTFYKGKDSNKEEYSCYNATDKDGNLLRDRCSKDILISGIASEYCIKESVLALHKNHFNITVLEKGLAYVDLNGHIDTIELLKDIVKFK